jgi:hypothetical protein
MGCNAVLRGPDHSDFILEVDIFSGDNDGVGFVFGWKSADDHHVVMLMDDKWPVWAADGIPGPFIKFKRRIPGRLCGEFMNESSTCFATYAHLDSTNSSPFSVPATYAQSFVPYPTTTPFRLTLIVREGQARVTFQAPLSQQKVMLRAAMPLNTYSGGRVGLTTYANNPRFSNLRLTDLSVGAQPSSFCDGTARCEHDGYCGAGWEAVAGEPPPCPPMRNGAAVFFAVVGWLLLGGLGAAAYFGRLPPSFSRRAGVAYPDGVVRLARKVSPSLAAWLAGGGGSRAGTRAGGQPWSPGPATNPSPLESNYRAPLAINDACASNPYGTAPEHAAGTCAMAAVGAGYLQTASPLVQTAMPLSAGESAVPAVAIHVPEFGDERPAPTYDHSSSGRA